MDTSANPLPPANTAGDGPRHVPAAPEAELHPRRMYLFLSAADLARIAR
jgi:hypothetical protein